MAEAENKIQSKVLDYLIEQGLFVFRTNNGATFDRRLNNGFGGYRSQSKYAAPGLADALMVLPKTGQLIGIEFKTQKGKQSADQVLFERRLKRNGGDYFVIRSLDEAKEMLSELKC